MFFNIWAGLKMMHISSKVNWQFDITLHCISGNIKILIKTINWFCIDSYSKVNKITNFNLSKMKFVSLWFKKNVPNTIIIIIEQIPLNSKRYYGIVIIIMSDSSEQKAKLFHRFQKSCFVFWKTKRSPMATWRVCILFIQQRGQQEFLCDIIASSVSCSNSTRVVSWKGCMPCSAVYVYIIRVSLSGQCKMILY